MLAGSFVPLDLPSIFAAASAAPSRSDELDRGIRHAQSFFDTHLDPSTAMPGDLDTVSLDALTASRTRLVLDGSALEPFDGRFTPGAPPRAPAAATRRRGHAVVATDPGLESFLGGDAPPALRAAHLLGALAVIQSEQPSLAAAVALRQPGELGSSDEFVTALLAGLRANPLRAAGDRRHAARRDPPRPSTTRPTTTGRPHAGADSVTKAPVKARHVLPGPARPQRSPPSSRRHAIAVARRPHAPLGARPTCESGRPPLRP